MIINTSAVARLDVSVDLPTGNVIYVFSRAVQPYIIRSAEIRTTQIRGTRPAISRVSQHLTLYANIISVCVVLICGPLSTESL
ncbi:hypothetical protein ALO59_200028 [Pseudomonas amygdali pv. mellea]|nr:hypothetical protein ALO59_200028 [Pseudomonas amygdali pv. mellea]